MSRRKWRHGTQKKAQTPSKSPIVTTVPFFQKRKKVAQQFPKFTLTALWVEGFRRNRLTHKAE